MRDGWPTWAREAWRSLAPAQRERARTVWTTLADTFDGVLVGPGPLVRLLVEEGGLGHRSTLETIALLAGEDLVHVRHAAEGPILWVPAPLMPDRAGTGRSQRRPRFLASPRSNGSRQAARAEA